MKRFSVTFTVIALSAVCRAGGAEAPGAAEPATNAVLISAEFINAVMAEARTNTPALRAAGSRVTAAAANMEAVRTWEDPVLKFGGLTASARGFKESEEGNIIYGADQKLPLWGKPQLARRVAGAEVSTRRAELDYRWQMLRHDVAKQLLNVALAEHVVDTGEQDLSWLNTTVSAMESKYRAGQASLAETLTLQNELAKRADQLRTDRLNRVHARFALNRLLNRGLHASWPPLRLPEAVPPINYDEELVEIALRNEPRLKIARQEIKRAEAAAQATRRSRLPDLAVGIEGRQYSGDGLFREGMLTVSFNVPLFNRDKYRSDLRREEAKLKAAEEERDDQILSVREELHHLTVEIDAMRRQALLYRDEILPRAQQALTSALSNWESNRGVFREVLDARRMLLEAQLMGVRAVTEQHQLVADLLLVTGQTDLAVLQRLIEEPTKRPGGGSNLKTAPSPPQQP